MTPWVAARRVLTSTRVLKAVTRAASADDLPHVARLLQALGPAASEESIAGFLRHGGELWVATLLGEVVGVAVLEWLHPVQSPRPQAWLTALVTDAPARHRGVARALLEEAARRVRLAGGACLRVGCLAQRDELRAFFCATGFEARLIVFERPLG